MTCSHDTGKNAKSCEARLKLLDKLILFISETDRLFMIRTIHTKLTSVKQVGEEKKVGVVSALNKESPKFEFEQQIINTLAPSTQQSHTTMKRHEDDILVRKLVEATGISIDQAHCLFERWVMLQFSRIFPVVDQPKHMWWFKWAFPQTSRSCTHHVAPTIDPLYSWIIWFDTLFRTL